MNVENLESLMFLKKNVQLHLKAYLVFFGNITLQNLLFYNTFLTIIL